MLSLIDIVLKLELVVFVKVFFSPKINSEVIWAFAVVGVKGVKEPN